MLFGRNKYNYISMFVLYMKFDPLGFTINMLYNLIDSFIPTINIIITAAFINNAINAYNDLNKLNSIIMPLVAIVAIKLFNFYVGIIISLVNKRTDNRIRTFVEPAIATKQASIKFKYFEHQESVDVTQRALKKFEENIRGCYNQIINAWKFIARIIGFVLILGTQLWWASIIFAVTCIPLTIISYKYGKKRYDTDKELTRIERKVNYISDVLTSRDTVDERFVFGYTNKVNDEYISKYELVRKKRKKVTRSWWIHMKTTSMITFITGILLISILIPSAIIPGSEVALSIGMFIAIVNAVLNLSKHLEGGISELISGFKYKIEYFKDLNSFLRFDEDKEATSIPCKNTVELDTIEFKNVSFKYPDSENEIIKNLSLKLIAGKHYAIVGANGAGKTTLIKLLTKLYDNYEGEILINGKELKEYPLSYIKSLTSVVYQDFCRYPLDFYNNISIGNINKMDDRENVENAVRLIGLADVVDNLPKKYKTALTKVKSDGVDLSGGEWQRIALARLMVSQAQLKILDEPTAALDPISESKVYEQFRNIINNSKDNDKTITIFISHRLASTRLADEIIVLSDGMVQEIGPFADLMAIGGIYTEMFNAQAEWYREKNVINNNGEKSYV